jgi:hypothetical protein
LLADVLVVGDRGPGAEGLDVDPCDPVVVAEEDVRGRCHGVDRKVKSFRERQIERRNADAVALLVFQDGRREEVAGIVKIA